MLLVLPLSLVACNDNNLIGKNDGDQSFDTADSWTPPPVDTTTDPVDTDSGVVVIPEPVECDPRDFPAHTIDHMEDCEGEEANPDWNLSLKWDRSDIGWMISSAVMVNLTDDNGNGKIDDSDIPDVIANPYSGAVYALDGATGATLWSTSSTAIEQSTPAVGDVDGDGFPEVYIQGLYGGMMVEGYDGTKLYDSPPGNNIKTYCGGPGMTDFEADGAVEVYFGRQILDASDGSILCDGTGGQGTTIPGEGPISVAADIDGDGIQELVGGNTLYDNSCGTIWTASVSDGFPAVGNFDSDAEGEILITSQGSAHLLDDDGTEIWSYSYPHGGYGGPPAIADVDGDGEPNAIVAYQSGVSVLDEDGNEFWTYSHTTGTLYDGVSTYDFDGDGDYEVVLNDPTNLTIFDGPTGDILAQYPNGGVYTCGQEPTMADIDNDGHAEIAVTYGMSSGTGVGGVKVLGDTAGFAAALSVWNQHQFSLTNIERDGTVPEPADINWLTYNTFRAGPPISYVQVNQNLVGQIDDVCNDNCDFNEITVWWSVGNNGAADVDEPIVVEIWGDTDSGWQLLHDETITETLTAGQMNAAHETTLTGVPLPLYDLQLIIDGGSDSAHSEVEECSDTDNSPTWGAFICLE